MRRSPPMDSTKCRWAVPRSLKLSPESDGPHTLRVTAATTALDHEVDIVEVQSGSGTQPSQQREFATGDKCNPKRGFKPEPPEFLLLDVNAARSAYKLVLPTTAGNNDAP